MFVNRRHKNLVKLMTLSHQKTSFYILLYFVTSVVNVIRNSLEQIVKGWQKAEFIIY